MMSWWKRMSGRSSAAAAGGRATAAAVADQRASLIASSAAARRRYWSRLGTVDTDVRGLLIASRFIAGMPIWPSGREAYLVVRRQRTVLLATDGLSDTNDIEFRDRNGHGVELFIEVPAAALPTPIGSPYLDLLIQMARNVAHSPGTLDRWRKLQLLSMELPADMDTARLVNAEGRQVLLLGMPGFDHVPAIDGMPLSETKAMAVTIVHPADFEKIRREGAGGRARLAEALERSGHGHLSDFGRRPVL